MTYLLTSHGTLLCRERASGNLVHRPIANALEDADILDIGDVTQALQVDFSHFLRDSEDAMRVALGSGPLAGWTLTRSADHRSLLASLRAQYLVAAADNETVLVREGDPGTDALFLPLDQQDLAVLVGVTASKWLVRSAGETMRPERAELTPMFGLRFGGMAVDLRWNMPLDRSEWPHRLTLLRDAWRIEHVFRYRPLVYFVAYGNALVMRQFALNLMSLVTVGEYDGDIVVITDKTPAEIAALLPDGSKASIVLLPMEARDRVGYMSARYGIARWPGAWDYQPLLYVDADMLFDMPVAPMLHEIAQSDRIGAVEEPHALADSPFVGGHLLQDDSCTPAPNERGFNSGTLGIPNMTRHGRTIALIGRVLQNRLTQCGRESMPFVDQPVANYVSFRDARIDTALLSRYVRLASEDADPMGRTGLVHYCWVPDPQRRVEIMERYLDRLRAIS